MTPEQERSLAFKIQGLVDDGTKREQESMVEKLFGSLYRSRVSFLDCKDVDLLLQLSRLCGLFKNFAADAAYYADQCLRQAELSRHDLVERATIKRILEEEEVNRFIVSGGDDTAEIEAMEKKAWRLLEIANDRGDIAAKARANLLLGKIKMKIDESSWAVAHLSNANDFFTQNDRDDFSNRRKCKRLLAICNGLLGRRDLCHLAARDYRILKSSVHAPDPHVRHLELFARFLGGSALTRFTCRLYPEEERR